MDYKDTLNLPQTDFPMKARLAEREPERLKRWETDGLYEQVLKKNQGRPVFLLHDGPPYANGHIHFGHILNKTLKDFIVKYRNMSGWYCPFIPGWDCHGLPIEHHVDKNLGKKEMSMSKLEVRQACRDYAAKFVDIQRQEFKRIGGFGDWEHPYLTMDYHYEAEIARQFAHLVEHGAIYKGKKPVLWCARCRTALAEAEVEYENHVSPSIYVQFPLGEAALAKLPELKGREAAIVIWTTTPWTLPSNLAVALQPHYDYVAAEIDGSLYIVANNCLDNFLEVIGQKSANIVTRFGASILEGTNCRNPLLKRDSLIVLSDHVTMDTGTGCVHIAPGHGEEDYLVGKKYGLATLAPLDDRGRFTDEVGLPELVGQAVVASNDWILERLRERGLLLKQETLEHSYPHCWRCKQPVIFRATAQWFLSLSHNDLRQKALDFIRRVQWIPEWGRERIYGMVLNRPDWCLSRQRSWGVPIMAFECSACGEAVLDAKTIFGIADEIEKYGADIWFDEEKPLRPQIKKCPRCGEDQWRRETDILDVWFDSGVSFAPVIEQRLGLKLPADLYLEGNDQHRGWFHSSLLVAVGTRGQAPYKAVLTHGFVVDGEGRKYSKSARNYTPPEKVISQSGAEILRLWVAAEDYSDNIRVSEEIFGGLREAYRKIRNTARFLLGNLYDFDLKNHAVSLQDMDELDRYALHQLQRLVKRVRSGYESYAFHTVFHELNRFCTVELSAFYLDILKDRLYTAPAASRVRRSAQTALHEITRTLAIVMAPILSFTADEIWEFMPETEGQETSVHLAEFPEQRSDYMDEPLAERWEALRAVREEVMRVLEQARQSKQIGNALEAKLQLAASGEVLELLESFQSRLPDVFIVSQVALEDSLPDGAVEGAAIPELSMLVSHAPGQKCVRCWKWLRSVGQDERHPDVCQPCAQTLSSS